MAGVTSQAAAVFSLVNEVFNRSINLIVAELRLQLNARAELNNLQRTLLRTHSLLDEAKARRLTDKSLVLWLMELKEWAYDADDILDEYEAAAIRLKVTRSTFKRLIDHVIINVPLAHKVADVRKRLNGVTLERELNLGALEGSQPLDATKRGVTTSLLTESCIVGRAQDKENLIRLLLEPSDGAVPVVPIVGLGGAGKTTLSQLIFNDKRVEEHFPLRMWVCVSDDFDVKRITREITEYATNGRFMDLTNLNMLQVNLKEEIRGTTFLLVLDDVWNEDPVKWESLLAPLDAGGRGSVVIVTTQSKKVADITGTMEPYVLEELTEDDSWSLIESHSFREASCSSTNPRMEEIGRKIAKKISGLPYGATAMGRYLRSKHGESSWREVLEAETWEMPPAASDVLSALKRSYDNLPPQLKLCFAFCALFPKGYRFRKDTLIHMWIAQNLIQSTESKRSEDMAEECFDDLVCRFFFRYSWGNYVMNDSVHDLARWVSLDEYFRADEDSPLHISKPIRHLSWCSESITNVLEDNNTGGDAVNPLSSLRTLLFLGQSEFRSYRLLETMFRMLSRIRVLDFSNCFIRKLPSSVGNLKHLRYLGLSNTRIQRLPESVTRLCLLQTLLLEGCELCRLPRSMSRLVKLRQLKANPDVVADIAKVGRLIELQELKAYNVDKKKGHGIAELSAMNQLHGGLSIRNLQNVEKTRESRKARLDEKQKLKLLELRWADGRGAGECDRDRKVLKGLRPHPNLRELSIKYYGGTSSPSWMTDQYLPNMETIRLRSCARLTELPCLGQLHLLRHLHIDGMSQVRQINLQFYGTGEVSGFPLLELLNICRMPRLEEWSEPRRNCCYFPRLHKLLIEDCPRLRNLPSLPPTLEELRISRTGLVDLPGFHGNGDVTTNVSLSSLHVSECRELRSLSEGLLQHHLVALKTAAFTDCDSLEFLPAEGFRTAISLESLIMTNCPLPSSFLLPSSLEHLKLQPCLYPNNNEDSLSTCFQNLTSLSFLDIKDCPNLLSFPPGPLCQLSALQHLSLVNCQRLQSIGFQALTALESLTIQNCPRLTMSHSLVEVNNSSDTRLAFNITRWMRRRTGDDDLMLRHRVQNDSFFGGLLQHLTFLQFLKICQCPQLVTFTGEEEEKWRNLTSLQILHIVDCPNLEVLPANLQSLCSLSTLYIVRCPRIHAFPPGGVSMSLAHLVIHECPQLCQRCDPPGGEDWPLIAVVPRICLGRTHPCRCSTT
ncbi:putative disease resistance protein RGA1 [Musa acuminata AAA Group]|uniref:putative disease resistance protein RGA1 n=1 Tax=Musa acuminata AAA Group TaxID=214697 RepID=UPI0031D1CBD1